MKVIEKLKFRRLSFIGLTKRDKVEPFPKYEGRCPYCGGQCRILCIETKILEFESEDWGWRVNDCPHCGWWWTIEGSYNFTAPGLIVNVGLLHRTNNLPSQLIEAICEIKNDKERLFNMHPTKFEEFVGSLLASFYDCKVLHVGKSYDGGIDLVVIESDIGIVPVQIKRRSTPSKTEGVATIREFRGALLEKGADRGIIVTTANHFSGKAVDSTKPASHHSYLQKIDLIDCRRLFDIMNLIGLTKVDDCEIMNGFKYAPEDVLNRIRAKIVAAWD